MKYHSILSFCIMLSVAGTATAQKKNSNTRPYPLGNPVITHMYTADASPHVMPDGRMWMVTSVDSDKGGGYPTMHSYHTFSSADMKNWVDHGEVFNIDDAMPKDLEKQDWALWAPDMIYRNGKYYLYYPIWIHHVDSVRANGKPGRVVTSYIGVAVSDAPDKKFKVLNPRIEGTAGIDPAVYADDDGKVYLLWGHKKIAELNNDMMSLKTKPVELDLNTDRFMEAIWMHKRDGKYYVSYHTLYDNKVDADNPDDPARRKSELAWSWANNIMGPYHYGGVVNYELGVHVTNGPMMPGRAYVPWRLTQSNHVGITEYHGQSYLFYHTSALSSWRQDEFKNMGTWTQRSVCIDKLEYDAEGNIKPVQQTTAGVNAVKIEQPFAVTLISQPVSLVKDVVINNVDLGTGYYYFHIEVTGFTQPFTLEIRTDQGELMSTVPILKNGITEAGINQAKGKMNIVLRASAPYNAQLVKAELFAGEPKKL